MFKATEMKMCVSRLMMPAVQGQRFATQPLLAVVEGNTDLSKVTMLFLLLEQ